MVKCQVEKCCCGCSLKLGVILIGILNILNFLAGITLLIEYKQNGIEALQRYGFRSGADLITTSVLGLIGLLIGICLIHGARKDLAKLLLIGLLFYIGVNVIQIILFFVTSAGYFIDGKPQAGALELFKCVVGGLFTAYFSVVIHSLRLQIQGNAAGAGVRSYNA